MADITERLRELSKARWDKDAWERETTVRIPAEPDRDIDLVLSNAAAEIDRLRARVAELEAERADQFTGQLVEIDGHTYGLRPGAARVVREALADDPELDCTDFAKPAWWRGEAYGSSAAIAAMARILDGKDDGRGVANEPWQSVRTRLREAMRDAGRAAMLESMLACEREKVTNSVRLLTGIHSLLYPAHITAEDGRVWAFRPRSIDPHEVLQELSDRIRELPEKIAAMAKDGA